MRKKRKVSRRKTFSSENLKSKIKWETKIRHFFSSSSSSSAKFFHFLQWHSPVRWRCHSTAHPSSASFPPPPPHSFLKAEMNLLIFVFFDASLIPTYLFITFPTPWTAKFYWIHFPFFSPVLLWISTLSWKTKKKKHFSL